MGAAHTDPISSADFAVLQHPACSMWCDSLQPKESRMGAPSDEQIDEMIAYGLANRWSEDRIL